MSTAGDLGADSLFGYIHGELRRGYFLDNDEERYTDRRQKFYTFLRAPFEFEHFMIRAFFQILDTFLYTFTLLPLRFVLSVWLLVIRSIKYTLVSFRLKNAPANNTRGRTSQLFLSPAETCDLLKGLILICATSLIGVINTNVLYHITKTQSVIKLYIFFNMLEVADKLLSAFGCDILGALFWTATEPIRPHERGRQRLGVLSYLVASIFYVLVHGLSILLQATTLNVAINSTNKAFLTVLMSNNFVELKGMVFKKFERNNLFHMSCSDVRERHHLLVLLIIVILRTIQEYGWSADKMYLLLENCLYIMLAEIAVDWCKHAFVTRFNEISSDVYRDYTVTLAIDLAGSKLDKAYADQSELISRRTGFMPLPLAMLLLRTVSSSISVPHWLGYVCLILGYLCLLTFKIIVNIQLLANSYDIIKQEKND